MLGNANYVVVCLIIMTSTLATAQSYDPDAQRTGMNQLTQSGRMVTLKLQPAKKEVHLEFVGNEAAGAKIDEGIVQVSYGLGEKRQMLHVVKTTDPKTKKSSWVFKRPADSKLENLEIKLKSGPTEETFVVPDLK